MCRQTFKSIFLSDIHIGSKDAKLDKLFDFLSSVKTDNIFLIGDIIDRHIDDDNIELKKFIDILDSKESKVIYILGNHEESRGSLPKLLNSFELYKEYIYTIGNKKALLYHGHSYDTKDSFLKALKMIAKKSQIKRDDNRIKAGTKRRLHRLLKKIAKLTLHQNFAKYISLKAKKSRCQIVITGHFHVAKSRNYYGIDYFNCGDWISNTSFVTESFNGNLELIKIK